MPHLTNSNVSLSLSLSQRGDLVVVLPPQGIQHPDEWDIENWFKDFKPHGLKFSERNSDSNFSKKSLLPARSKAENATKNENQNKRFALSAFGDGAERVLLGTCQTPVTVWWSWWKGKLLQMSNGLACVIKLAKLLEDHHTIPMNPVFFAKGHDDPRFGTQIGWPVYLMEKREAGGLHLRW